MKLIIQFLKERSREVTRTAVAWEALGDAFSRVKRGLTLAEQGDIGETLVLE